MIQETQEEINAREWYKEFCRINGKPYNFKENQVAAKEYWTLLAARNSLIHLPDMSKINVPTATYVAPTPAPSSTVGVITTNEQSPIIAEVATPSVEFVPGPEITFDAIDRKNYGDAIVDAAKNTQQTVEIPTVVVVEPVVTATPVEVQPTKPSDVSPTPDPLFTDTTVGQTQKVETKNNKNIFYVVAVVLAIAAFLYFKQ